MSAPTSTHESAYQAFQRAIAQGIQPTVLACWTDFAHWEAARNYGDDPSHPAKLAIEWIDQLEELRDALEDFSGGALNECYHALDQASEAFARLEHSVELVHAIKRWIQYRLEQ